jgi:hypothetical protein
MESSDFPTIWEYWSPFVRSQEGSFAERTRNGKISFSGRVASPLHSQGAGPAWTLSKYVLGVAPIGAGFERCRIDPRIGGLKWAKGVFPSVRGDIVVDWKAETGSFLLKVELPTALETEIAVPRDVKKPMRFIHNGASYNVPAGTAHVPGLAMTADRIEIRVTGGSHRLEVALSGEN